MASPPDRKWSAAIVATLLVTLAVMGPLCGADFCGWDDSSTIAKNPRLNPPSLAGVGYYWTHSDLWLYVPVTYTLWSGLAAIGRVETPDPVTGVQVNPWVFHTANVLIHLGNVLLVLVILRLLFPDIGPSVACAGALLFGVHPVQVETVAWASGTKDLLCGLFSLLAVWQYLRYARSGGGNVRHLMLGIVALVMALLSKPTAMVVPPIVAVLDVWIVGRPLRRVARAVGPWFVVVIPFMILARLIQPAATVPGLPIWERPFLVGATVAFYLGKLIAPIHVAFDYGWRPGVLVGQPWFHVLWLIPAGLWIVLWRTRRRWPVPFAAALVFVLGIAPVIGFTQFLFQIYSTVADHYLYLAMLGPAILLAGLLPRVGAAGRRVATWVAALFMAVCAVRSAAYVPAWQDAVSLDRHTVAVNPASFFSFNDLGNNHLARAETLEQAGQPKEAYAAYAMADEAYRRSIGAYPEQQVARRARAWTLVCLARLEFTPAGQTARLREAVAEYEWLQKADPSNADVDQKLQSARQRLGEQRRD